MQLGLTEIQIDELCAFIEKKTLPVMMKRDGNMLIVTIGGFVIRSYKRLFYQEHFAFYGTIPAGDPGEIDSGSYCDSVRVYTVPHRMIVPDGHVSGGQLAYLAFGNVIYEK